MQNKFIEAMKYRYACKGFDENKKVSDEDFNTILEIGRISPSSFGFEPWRFVIIQNKDLRKKLEEFSWGALDKLSNASHFMIILSRKSKSMAYDSKYIEHILKDIKEMPEDVIAMYKEFYENFLKKDFKLQGNDKAIFDWATKQTYIPLANMMIGAAYMGIDSCPVEGFNFDKTEAFLKDELDIDTTEFGPAVMLSFGYRKDSPKREKTRQNIDTIVKWY